MMKNLFLCLSIILLTLTLNSNFSVQADESTCKDVLLLFARGSGQNPLRNLINHVEDPEFIRDEPQSYMFFKEISSRIVGLSIEKITLHDFEGKYNSYGYQAVDAIGGMFNLKPDHRKDVSNRYYESVADGAEELAWFLEDRLTSCPFQQIILGGYSQGAHVVGDALFKLQPAFRPRIAYVALFGDPKFNPRTSTIPIITGDWVRGNALAIQTGILMPRGNYLPDEVLSKTSWCDFSDPICANYTPGIDPVIGTLSDIFIDRTHTSIYQNKWIPQAANEIVSTIKKRTPSLAGNINTIQFVNKNDKLYQTDLALVIDTTGSMVDEFSNIKKRLSTFSSSLFSSYWDTRIGVVVFNDDFPWEHTYFSKTILDFTYSKDAVSAAINSLTAEKGGDEPEAQYSGLMTAMNELSWRNGAQKKILVITDAPPKNPDPGPEKWTKEQVVKRALELDPVSISFVKLPTATSGWRNPYTNAVNYLASNTGGIIYEPQAYQSANITTYITDALSGMDTLPVAAITGETAGTINQPLNLSGGDSYDPDGAIVSYSWDCNNDEVWESSGLTEPTYSCLYSEPYSGLVVLQVTSSDGGMAKAIINVNITDEIIVKEIPATPDVVYSRYYNEIFFTWKNNYPNGTTMVATDSNGNVIWSTTEKYYVFVNPPNEAFAITLRANNENSWSEPAILQIEPKPSSLINSEKPVPISTPNPIAETQGQIIIPNSSNSNPVVLLNEQPATALNNQTVPATMSLTQVEGIQKTEPILDHQASVPLQSTQAELKVLLISLAIFAIGFAAIAWKLKTRNT